MRTVKGLAFFDLDGTLLDEHSNITIEISQAMVELRENGIMPIIATGRTNVEIRHICSQTGIDSVITMNGQHISFAGETVYSNLIPQETAAKMTALAKELGQEMGFYTPEQITVTGHTPLVETAYAYINAGMPVIHETFYEERDLNMLLVIGEDQDQHYHEHFPELTFYRNGPYTIDVVGKGASKGNAVRELVKTLGLEGVPTYAFGDGINDIELFKACDYRIAMGNARDELKELATYVSSKNTDGGILRGLRQYGLIR